VPSAKPPSSPSRPIRRQPWTGPAASLGLAALLVLIRRWTGYSVPNPNLLFGMIIVLAAYLGGLGSGLASAGIAIAFTAWDWAIPGHPFRFTPENLQRMLVALTCLPGMAVLVGVLKMRTDAHHRTILSYLALERERNRELAEALADSEAPEGAVPVCAWCRKVREPDGRWESLEAHLAHRYGTIITHGICPECRPAFSAGMPIRPRANEPAGKAI